MEILRLKSGSTALADDTKSDQSEKLLNSGLVASNMLRRIAVNAKLMNERRTRLSKGPIAKKIELISTCIAATISAKSAHKNLPIDRPQTIPFYSGSASSPRGRVIRLWSGESQTGRKSAEKGYFSSCYLAADLIHAVVTDRAVPRFHRASRLTKKGQ